MKLGGGCQKGNFQDADSQYASCKTEGAAMKWGIQIISIQKLIFRLE